MENRDEILKKAEQGDAEAQCKLGQYYYDTKESGKAFDWYRKAAEQNNSNAQFKLGECYESGIGVGVDLKKAIELYEVSANQGNAEAEYKLGEISGADGDINKAVTYYQKACTDGDSWIKSMSILRIAQLYYNEEKYDEVFETLQKSKFLNNDSQYLLGICYYLGQGTDKNYKNASSCFQKVIESEYFDEEKRCKSLYYLGNCLLYRWIWVDEKLW